jgi:pyruvate dehydrogenase E1 component
MPLKARLLPPVIICVLLAEQFGHFYPQGLPYICLGTDGFGRSDSREKLREHFQVNRYFIVIAALNALADDGVIGRSVVQDALERFEIDAEKPYAPLV